MFGAEKKQREAGEEQDLFISSLLVDIVSV